MDGYTLSREVRELIQETGTSEWLDSRTTYDFIYQAVLRFVMRTECLTAITSVTTSVSALGIYDLSPTYMGLYLKDQYNRYYISYNDLTTTYFIYQKDWSQIVLENNTTAQAIPNCFAIIDYSTSNTPITGTITTGSSLSNGETTLIDSTANFTTVNVGDTIHNTTDDSHGYIIEVLGTTSVIAAMFDGTKNYFSLADNYVIVPQAKYKLIINPPSSVDSHVISIPHVQRPAPVYSPYRRYRILPQYKDAIVQYAAWLYKYRDREPNFGDKFFRNFDIACRTAGRHLNKSLQREGFRVNYTKRNPMSSTWR